jgi:hypothetical protein
MSPEEILKARIEVIEEIKMLEFRLKKAHEISRTLSNPRLDATNAILLWNQLSSKRSMPAVQREH